MPCVCPAESTPMASRWTVTSWLGSRCKKNHSMRANSNLILCEFHDISESPHLMQNRIHKIRPCRCSRAKDSRVPKLRGQFPSPFAMLEARVGKEVTQHLIGGEYSPWDVVDWQDDLDLVLHWRWQRDQHCYSLEHIGGLCID